MSTPIPTAQELQEQVISAIRKGQETTLDVIKHVVEAVSAATSKLPSAPEGISLPLSDKLPTPEAVVAKAYDFAGQILAEQRKLAEKATKLPTPQAIVSGAYDFTGRLLAEQRTFTEEVLKATAALRPASAKSETKSDTGADETAE
jgi:hypothetical protein